MTPFSIGVLIALFERTVGLYASLVNINAYHQPGVEAGKRMAGAVLEQQAKIVAALKAEKGPSLTACQIAAAAKIEDVVTVFKICEHLAANSNRSVRKTVGPTPFESGFAFVS